MPSQMPHIFYFRSMVNRSPTCPMIKAEIRGANRMTSRAIAMERALTVRQFDTVSDEDDR